MGRTSIVVYVHLVVAVLLACCARGQREDSAAKSVAIIGGGVAGTFAAKYLVDYDQKCSLESVVVFDSNPISQDVPLNAGGVANEEHDSNYSQGSRVASVKLQDGTTLELGASIAYKGFHHFIEMLDGDDELQQGKPFSTGLVDEQLATGFGVYNGNGDFAVLTSNTPSFLTKFKLLYRYNVDFIRLTMATSHTESAFAQTFSFLKDIESFFFSSPNEMWARVGLLKQAQMPFDDYLESIGITKELAWWRQYLPYQGSLRDELVTAINLCNYNQDNSQLNALVGLGSFATTKGGLFSIVGGNHQVLDSAMKQARANHEANCNMDGVEPVQKRVTTVVGELNGKMQLYGSDQEDLGEFDVVILAAPLQQARIEFLIQSHMDAAVLLPMPLTGMINAHEAQVSSDMAGHDVLPKPLPSHATRPYTSVVTTVVSGADLEAVAQHFSLPATNLPRSILVTENGKRSEGNITAVTQISSKGVYKVFSSSRLGETALKDLFGKNVVVEHVQVWGGPYGGATPDFRGQGETLNYMLYNVGHGLEEGHKSKGFGALFYANAIESSFACMELSAIGAKSAAKLAAKHLELVIPTKSTKTSDEL